MQPSETFAPRRIRLDSFVRLVQPLPESGLRPGHVGVVRALLPGLADAFEVEFHRVGQDVPSRALLLTTQIELQEGPLLTDGRVTAFQW